MQWPTVATGTRLKWPIATLKSLLMYELFFHEDALIALKIRLSLTFT